MPSNAPGLYQHQNNGHKVYQELLMDGGLIIGGTETSTRDGGYMEGAVNSARTVAKIVSK